jgi:hypothetical protein
MAYRTIVVDLTTDYSAAKRELVPRGIAIAGVTVEAMADGTAFNLHVGESSDPITVEHGDELQCCGSEDGLFASFAAQPGKTVTLHVATKGGTALREVKS